MYLLFYTHLSSQLAMQNNTTVKDNLVAKEDALPCLITARNLQPEDCNCARGHCTSPRLYFNENVRISSARCDTCCTFSFVLENSRGGLQADMVRRVKSAKLGAIGTSPTSLVPENSALRMPAKSVYLKKRKLHVRPT